MAKEHDLGWALGLQDRDEVPWPVEDGRPGAWTGSGFRLEPLEAPLKVEQRTCDVSQLPGGHSSAEQSGWHLMSPEPLNAQDLMRLVRHNNRVSPTAAAWLRLYSLLPNRTEAGRVLYPPYPVDSTSVQMTTDVQKQHQLRSQFEWAESAGALDRLLSSSPHFRSMSGITWTRPTGPSFPRTDELV